MARKRKDPGATPEPTDEGARPGSGDEKRSRSGQSKRTGKRAPRPGLTEAQELFCAAYVVNGGNGVEAWRTAYPGRSWSGQAAAERASKLLAQDKVRARVDELAAIAKREAEEKFGVTVDWVICRLKLIADSNMCNYLSLDEKGGPSVTINDLDPERLFPLADFTVEDIESGRRVGKRSRVKLYNKVDALTKLGQYLGMFTERHEHVGKGGGPVQLVISSVEAQL